MTYKEHQITARKMSNTIKLIELRFSAPIDEILKQDYMINKLSIRDMAELYDVTPKTVHRWLVIFEIPRRKLSLD